MSGKTTVLGLMSGSSLDGLDICKVVLEETKGWHYQILKTQTLDYPEEISQKLASSPSMGGADLFALDIEFGQWIARALKPFMKKVDLIALHGHTVFHKPARGFSLQIGNPQKMATMLKTPVVADFRNTDILLGGQGAPLVPFGERALFAEYDAFLNLGGICNLTVRKNNEWLAGDIGPFNQVLNHLAAKRNQPFDKEGELAAAGQDKMDLMCRWSQMAFFKEAFPKSLDNFFASEVLNEVKGISAEDALHTYTSFIIFQMATRLNEMHVAKVMVSGGGTWNTYAMQQLRSKTTAEVVIPDKQLVDFKEALIFALLGLLKYQGRINVMSSCTGARMDSSSGVVFTGGVN